MSTEDVHLPGDGPDADTLAGHVDGLARRLLLLKALEKRVATELGECKRELRLAGLRPGVTMRPALADGKPAGSVGYSVGSVAAVVSDPEAFAEWTVEHYPKATSLEIKVAEWFTAQVLAASETAGVPLGPGGETAEDAPAGVKVGQRQGSISARPDPKRTDALWAEMQSFITELEAGSHE